MEQQAVDAAGMTRPSETGVTARGGPPRRGGGASGGESSTDGAAEVPGHVSLYASLATQRLLSRLILLLIATLWFGLLAAGCAAYEGVGQLG